MIGIVIGDCLDALPAMPTGSVDAIVTDPPYNLTAGKRGGSGVASLNVNSPAGRSRISTGGGFMGKEWDGTGVAFDPATWVECLRVLKPGGHLLAFGGTRTYHRLACAVEDAGFEIRDQLAWLYGSGFPKSLNVGKAIDKAAGAERAVVGSRLGQPGYSLAENHDDRTAYGAFTDAQAECAITAPATPEAERWDGWGTALKPAHEPIVLARKPLIGTVAANVLAHGAGALNVDGCRIEGRERTDYGLATAKRSQGSTFGKPSEVGGASRFFYVAKASSRERNAGLEGFEEHGASKFDGGAFDSASTRATDRTARNTHPTVKPIALMRWLVRLVTPPGGLVIDPFAGSGTTGIACSLEGLNFIGIEREAEYVEIARARIAHWGLPS